MNLFDILKDVIKDKSGSCINDIDFEKECNVFMIARFLSMRSDLTKYATFINKYGKVLTKENIYRYLLKVVPQTNNHFIKYIKKTVKDVEPEDKE